MSHNFVVIGRGNSEIWRWKVPERKKETSVVKHKTAWNYCGNLGWNETTKLCGYGPKFKDVFYLPNFKGAGFPKRLPKLPCLLRGTSREVSWSNYIWPQSWYNARTLNFGLFFEFSSLTNCWNVKIWGAAPPKDPNMAFRKSWFWVGQNAHAQLFC